MHYRINEIGDIQTAPPQHNGLTAFGHEVVREMNKLGMVIDTAHSSPDTLAGVLAESRVPVIFSHTGAYALRPLSRHLGDKEMHAIAARDGIVGIWPNLRRRDRFETFLKDIDYAQKLIGADHVGIGTDLFGLDNHTAITHPQRVCLDTGRPAQTRLFRQRCWKDRWEKFHAPVRRGREPVIIFEKG
jgi:membrane dipeptidase